jgi:hypothetical protein
VTIFRRSRKVTGCILQRDELCSYIEHGGRKGRRIDQPAAPSPIASFL